MTQEIFYALDATNQYQLFDNIEEAIRVAPDEDSLEAEMDDCAGVMLLDNNIRWQKLSQEEIKKLIREYGE